MGVSEAVRMHVYVSGETMVWVFGAMRAEVDCGLEFRSYEPGGGLLWGIERRNS